MLSANSLYDNVRKVIFTAIMLVFELFSSRMGCLLVHAVSLHLTVVCMSLCLHMMCVCVCTMCLVFVFTVFMCIICICVLHVYVICVYAMCLTCVIVCMQSAWICDVCLLLMQFNLLILASVKG